MFAIAKFMYPVRKKKEKKWLCSHYGNSSDGGCAGGMKCYGKFAIIEYMTQLMIIAKCHYIYMNPHKKTPGCTVVVMGGGKIRKGQGNILLAG